MDAVEDALPAPESEPLYFLCTFYTWALLALNVIEFFTSRSAPDFILSTFYFAALSAYAAHKEAGKWADPQAALVHPKRKGERFVFIWSMFLLVAWILPTFMPSFHLGTLLLVLHYPHELPTIVLEVVAVFTGTKISRHYRESAKAAPDTPKDPTDPPRDSQRSLAWTVKIIDEAVLLVLRELSTPEIMRQISLISLRDPDARTVQRALDVLVAQGKAIKISKGPRDPNTRYRRKSPQVGSAKP